MSNIEDFRMIYPWLQFCVFSTFQSLHDRVVPSSNELSSFMIIIHFLGSVGALIHHHRDPFSGSAGALPPARNTRSPLAPTLSMISQRMPGDDSHSHSLSLSLLSS